MKILPKWPTLPIRQLKAFILVFSLSMLLGVTIVVGVDGTSPTGFGSLFSLPDFTNGGPKSLFENYDQSAWFIDTRLGDFDLVQGAANGLVNLVFYILSTIVYAAIALVYWLSSFTKIEGVADPISSMIGASATGLMSWLFPTALALGALAAYTARIRDGRGGGH